MAKQTLGCDRSDLSQAAIYTGSRPCRWSVSFDTPLLGAVELMPPDQSPITSQVGLKSQGLAAAAMADPAMGPRRGALPLLTPARPPARHNAVRWGRL
jgi:hypothetical protein